MTEITHAERCRIWRANRSPEQIEKDRQKRRDWRAKNRDLDNANWRTNKKRRRETNREPMRVREKELYEAWAAKNPEAAKRRIRTKDANYKLAHPENLRRKWRRKYLRMNPLTPDAETMVRYAINRALPGDLTKAERKAALERAFAAFLQGAFTRSPSAADVLPYVKDRSALANTADRGQEGKGNG